jgi:hypothetical protein
VLIGQNSERGFLFRLSESPPALRPEVPASARQCCCTPMLQWRGTDMQRRLGPPRVVKLPNSRPQKTFMPSVESWCTKGTVPAVGDGDRGHDRDRAFRLRKAGYLALRLCDLSRIRFRTYTQPAARGWVHSAVLRCQRRTRTIADAQAQGYTHLRATCPSCGRIADVPWPLLIGRKGTNRNTLLGNIPLKCQRCGNAAPMTGVRARRQCLTWVCGGTLVLGPSRSCAGARQRRAVKRTAPQGVWTLDFTGLGSRASDHN